MTDIPIGHTPIIEMLQQCLGHELVSYHMPGHNRGAGFPQWLHDNALRIDTTEFLLTDDLHLPTGAFAQALTLAAKAFGAGRTFFVTTGATIAIHSALYALTKPGDLIIAGRNAHRALINACRMFGLRVLFVGDQSIPEAILAHPEAVLVYLTRPDYYGSAVDMSPIVSAVRSGNIPLLVDEAHGTHFAFAPMHLPMDALSCGGDVVIHSAHKTAPALTQGAYLHVSRNAMMSGRVSAEKLAQALSVISTSSPSFLIAATLDYARAFLEQSGEGETRRIRTILYEFYENLSPAWRTGVPALPPPDTTSHSGQPSIDHDLFRLVLHPLRLGIAPDALCTLLAEHGIHVEFFDLARVVLLCKFSNTREDFRLLSNALNRACEDSYAGQDSTRQTRDAHHAGLHMTPDACAERIRLQNRLDRNRRMAAGFIVDGRRCRSGDRSEEMESVPLSDAEGRTLAVDVILYPPGIPLLFAGDRMDAECLELVQASLHYGLTVYGVEVTMHRSDGVVSPHISCFCR
jgi:arginine/lysine/ornithine decarboxylase